MILFPLIVMASAIFGPVQTIGTYQFISNVSNISGKTLVDHNDINGTATTNFINQSGSNSVMWNYTIDLNLFEYTDYQRITDIDYVKYEDEILLAYNNTGSSTLSGIAQYHYGAKLDFRGANLEQFNASINFMESSNLMFNRMYVSVIFYLTSSTPTTISQDVFTAESPRYYFDNTHISNDFDTMTFVNLNTISTMYIKGFRIGFSIGAVDEHIAEVFTTDLYKTGYQNGYAEGYNQGYHNGEDYGYETGYNDFKGSEEYTEALDNAYESGVDYGDQQGYIRGLSEDNPYTFRALFGAIADTPILFIRQLLGFEVFGVEAIAILMTMVTGCLILFVFRRIVL